MCDHTLHLLPTHHQRRVYFLGASIIDIALASRLFHHIDLTKTQKPRAAVVLDLWTTERGTHPVPAGCHVQVGQVSGEDARGEAAQEIYVGA